MAGERGCGQVSLSVRVGSANDLGRQHAGMTFEELAHDAKRAVDRPRQFLDIWPFHTR